MQATATQRARSVGTSFVHLFAWTLVLAFVASGVAAAVTFASPKDLAGLFHAALIAQDPSPTLFPGAKTTYAVHVRNTGPVPWQRGTAREVRLGVVANSREYADAGMAVDWLAPDRPTTTQEEIVLPGMAATFSFGVRAPATPGTYRMPLRLVVDGVTWLGDGEPIVLEITSDLGFHSQLFDQSPHPVLRPGEVSGPLTMRFRNRGGRSWLRGVAGQQATLAVAGDDRTLAALGVDWPSADRVAIQAEQVVRPGELASFTFRVHAPSTVGTYALPLRLVVDGVTWLEDEGVLTLLSVSDDPLHAPVAAAGATAGVVATQTTATRATGVTFAIDGSAISPSVTVGGTMSIVAAFTSSAASTAIVGIEVFAPGGATLAYEKWFQNQEFAPDQKRVYQVSWNVPPRTTLGTYTVTAAAYSAGWKKLYASKPVVAAFGVTASTVATPTSVPTAAPSSASTSAPTTAPTGTPAPTASAPVGAPATPTATPVGTPAPTSLPTASTTLMPAPTGTSTSAPAPSVAPTTTPLATPVATPAPSFSTRGNTSVTSVFVGSSIDVAAVITSATATTALVDLEIYGGASATPAYQVWFDNQTFAAGQQRSYPATWSVPSSAAVGGYTLKIGVFAPGWATLYVWNDVAATFSVLAQPSPSPTLTPTLMPTPVPTVAPTPTTSPAATPVPSGTLFPADRQTAWNPGIPGGVPVRSTVCASLNAATYGNGGSDASRAIQLALDACPAGQVVQLSAGTFQVNSYLLIHSGITLRGAGPGVTTLVKTNGARPRLSPTQPVDPSTYQYDAQPIVIVGPNRWPKMNDASSTNLTADGAQGGYTVTVADASGLAAGQVVLVDELSGAYWQDTPSGFPGAAKVWAGDRVAWNMHLPQQQWQDDNSYSDAAGPYDLDGGVRVVPHAMSWFSRTDRPTNEFKEVASVSGNTVRFTTPLTISYRTSHTAQVTRTMSDSVHVRNAGIEDLTAVGGADGEIRFEHAAYSWAKNVEVTQWIGEGVAVNGSFAVEVRDSYIHTGSWPTPGGAGYAISFAGGSTQVLVENNIVVDTNKVMVMRSSGAGSVVGYNYTDDGWISYDQGWQEVGVNASHMSGPHHVLFEGNYSQNADSDYTHGNAIDLTFFRNWLSGKRRDFTDVTNVRAAGLAYGSWWDTFVGNVMGVPGMTGWRYEDPSMTTNTAQWTDRVIWKLGYDPERWTMVPDPKVMSTVIREGNFDYVTNQVHWSGAAQTLPASLYLGAKPAFFGSNPWPWVDPTGATKTFTLPARARYDAMPGH